VNNKLIALDTNAMPWEERPNEKIGRSLYRKNLIEDPDTGMEVRLVRYPAGAPVCMLMCGAFNALSPVGCFQ